MPHPVDIEQRYQHLIATLQQYVDNCQAGLKTRKQYESLTARFESWTHATQQLVHLPLDNSQSLAVLQQNLNAHQVRHFECSNLFHYFCSFFITVT